MSSDLIAVLDVGKSNARLAVLTADTGEVIWRKERPVQVFAGPIVQQLSVADIEAWVIASLTSLPERDRIRYLVPIAHGAAAALVGPAGEVIVVPDYEASVFDTVADAYREARDPFAATYSPMLARGLNLGRQLFYFHRVHPSMFNRVAQILLYPQYWSWRFSGVAASEISSLGCHSDLWRPLEAQYSHLAKLYGWSGLFPTLRRASDVLGPITAEFANATGLDRRCRVVCGIHDSNASYLCHIATHPAAAPLTVVSSGTWTILMTRGADLARLKESDDMLANVDASGTSVATARFMGGREYAAICGESGAASSPTIEAVLEVLQRQAMALPAFSDKGGPFAHQMGRLINVDGLGGAAHAALATLYLALMVDLLLDWLDARGEVIIGGPLALNPLFAPLLAAMRSSSEILVSAQRQDAVIAASILVGTTTPAHAYKPVNRLDLDALPDYRRRWRRELPRDNH